MKKLALLVAVSMIAGNAIAATNTKTAATKKAVATKKATTKAAAKTTTKTETAAPAAATPAAPATAQPAATPATAQPSTGAMNAGQSTASQAAVTAPAKVKRFGLLINDLATVGMRDSNLQKETVEAGGTLTVRPSYKLNDSTSVALGIDVTHSYGQLANGKSTWTPADAYAMVSKSNLGTLPGAVGVKGSLRVYAPTSESSQDIGQIAQTRANITFSKPIGKLTLSYDAEPRYYFNQYLTYTNKKGEETATRNLRYSHWIGASLAATSKLSVYTQAGLEHSWFNSDSNVKIQNNSRYTEKLLAETGLELSVTDQIALSGGITQSEPDLLAQEQGKEGPMYRDEFTEYFLQGTLNF